MLLKYEIKDLQAECKGMSRDAVSERMLEVIEHGMKDSRYQGLWEMVGRLYALAALASKDGYMNEKINTGARKEMHDVLIVHLGDKPTYRGYRGIIEKETV